MPILDQIAARGCGGAGGTALLHEIGEGVRWGGGTEFVGEGMTSQGRGIPKWRRPSSSVRGMTSQGKGDLKNFQNGVARTGRVPGRGR